MHISNGQVSNPHGWLPTVYISSVDRTSGRAVVIHSLHLLSPIAR